MTITLWARALQGAQPEPPKRIARGVALVLVGALCSSIGFAAEAQQPPIKRLTSKEYARGQLTVKNYKCIAILWGKESAWNWKAVGNLNGKHRVYGIPQGKSEFLRTASPLQQVDWGLRYVGHKYGFVRTIEGMQPNTCAALNHWRKRNWY
jgi:hypothetical protein